MACTPPSTCTISPVVAGNQSDSSAHTARAAGSAVVWGPWTDDAPWYLITRDFIADPAPQVTTPTSDGLVAHSEQATYSDAEKIVRAPGPVKFSRGRMSGTGIGFNFDEQRDMLTILEQAERHHTYRVDESPLPLDNLVGTLRVRDEGEGACVVEWEATFDPAGIPEDEAVELVRGIFQAGLDAL